MPLWVSIRSVPREDGEACIVINPVIWWDPWELSHDPRFRVINPNYLCAVACVNTKEMREMRDHYRHKCAGSERCLAEASRLDEALHSPLESRPWDDEYRWFVITVYEWESGLD
jgi:hypothetical protein